MLKFMLKRVGRPTEAFEGLKLFVSGSLIALALFFC